MQCTLALIQYFEFSLECLRLGAQLCVLRWVFRQDGFGRIDHDACLETRIIFL